MIKEKEVEIGINKGNVGYYRKLGYDCKVGDKIIRNIDDLSHAAAVFITAICDNCGKEVTVRYADYMKCCKRTGSYYCRDCGEIKRLENLRRKCREDKEKINTKRSITFIEKYGADNAMRIPEFKEKQQQTTKDRWGVPIISQNPEIQDKIKQTVMIRYGTDNVFKLPEFQEKAKNTNILRYGYPYTSQSPIVKEKQRMTIQNKYHVNNIMQSEEIRYKQRQSCYKNQSCSTSIQQKYLHELYGGELNYPLGSYLLDIAFPDEKLEICYDGGGHNLKVKLGFMTEKEFQTKEIIRGKYIRNQSWKSIHIITENDKLPSDEILLQILEISKHYFEDYPNHSWYEWNVDKGIYRNAEEPQGSFFDYGELRYIKPKDVKTICEKTNVA